MYKVDTKDTEGTEGKEVTGDNWKHRSQGMKCESCMWFVAKAGSPVSTDRGSLGRCRRHAPTMSGFPAVFSTDWCGDHKLDETKI